jgi:hypothetical protein
MNESNGNEGMETRNVVPLGYSNDVHSRAWPWIFYVPFIMRQ